MTHPHHRDRLIKIGLVIFFLLMMALLLWPIIRDMIPVMQEIMNGEDPQLLKEYLRSLGWEGVAITFLLQTLQIVSAVVPAAPVQVLAGITYGIGRGLVICLGGILLGHGLVFFAIRRFGEKITGRLFGDQDIQWLSRLRHSRHLPTILVLIYIIPGVPNGMIPYFAATTPIKPKLYFTLIFLASIPAILSCTFMGESIVSGHFTTALVILGIFAVVALALFVLRKQIFSAFDDAGGEDETPK